MTNFDSDWIDCMSEVEPNLLEVNIRSLILIKFYIIITYLVVGQEAFYLQMRSKGSTNILKVYYNF